MRIYELRGVIDLDDMEQGLRIACALYAENTGGWAQRYDAIVLRAYGTTKSVRMKREMRVRNT